MLHGRASLVDCARWLRDDHTCPSGRKKRIWPTGARSDRVQTAPDAYLGETAAQQFLGRALLWLGRMNTFNIVSLACPASAAVDSSAATFSHFGQRHGQRA